MRPFRDIGAWETGWDGVPPKGEAVAAGFCWEPNGLGFAFALADPNLEALDAVLNGEGCCAGAEA